MGSDYFMGSISVVQEKSSRDIDSGGGCTA